MSVFFCKCDSAKTSEIPLETLISYKDSLYIDFDFDKVAEYYFDRIANGDSISIKKKEDYHTGMVTIASYTGSAEGQVFTDIVQVQYTQSTAGGDSGGPVYSYFYPYCYTVGTHIGSYSNHAYYTKFSNIQDLYGITRY